MCKGRDVAEQGRVEAPIERGGGIGQNSEMVVLVVVVRVTMETSGRRCGRK